MNQLINVGGVFDTPYEFPLYYFDVHGVVLFADLSGYCSFAKDASSEECVYLTHHFFRLDTERYGTLQYWHHRQIHWRRDHAGLCLGMDIEDPVTLSLQTAKEMIEKDHFGFRPKIGIAEGRFAIAEVGSKDRFGVSAIRHIVNVASRCVGSVQANQIRVAAQHA